MEPRYNQGPRDWQNLFPITIEIRYIEVLIILFSLVPEHSLFSLDPLSARSLEESGEYLSVTSQLMVEFRNDRAENAWGLGCILLLIGLIGLGISCRGSLNRGSTSLVRSLLYTDPASPPPLPIFSEGGGSAHRPLGRRERFYCIFARYQPLSKK